jgi:peptidyl-tRNA hydrolase, PTH1 family
MADTAPWLVVGLGNPGSKYAHNRHNVGFMVVRAWADRFSPAPEWREKFHGRFASINDRVGRVVALMPQTYMNRSGQSVGAAASFHRTPVERVVVVHDELDFELGRLAVKAGGGHGGHNGLRDIVAHLGSPDFCRIRVGIGRPTHGDVSAWVLSDFSAAERAELDDVVDRARCALDCILEQGVQAAMNEFNRLPT